MSLRYRLFLTVSGLFIILAICSYFIENTVTRRGLKVAQDDLREKILTLSEKRRTDLQEFLASALAENEERINAILTLLSNFTPQLLRFGPTLQNSINGTWSEAADLLVEYKWIDFLQNTNQGKVTSAITPKQTNLDAVFRVPIDEDLSWVYIADPNMQGFPFLGVKVPYTLSVQSLDSSIEASKNVVGMIPEPYLLFKVQDMVSVSGNYTQPIFQSNDKNWPPIPVKWTEGYVLEVGPIVKAFQRARELLMAKKIQPTQLNETELKQKLVGISAEHRGKLSPIPVETLLAPGSLTQMMNKRLEEIALNYTQISLIWALIAVADNGIFGKDPFNFPAPQAISLFRSKIPTGVGLEVGDVLSSTRLFDDSGYFEKNLPSNPSSNIASSVAVITVPHKEHVYLGNTAQFKIKTPAEERIGYLTVGIDVDVILQRLVFAIHQTALMVHDGRPISVYIEDEKGIASGSEFALPLSQMLEEKSGIVTWENENYFFMHLQPFPNVDLHFFLFNPEKVQFALLRDLQEGSTNIIDSVLFDIHITGLIALIIAVLFLHYISRKVTGPIIQLAKATGEVAKGRLDQVQLTLPPLKHNDEIALLCHSFEEMVKGLKEKEKVKGVLNKVVSNEIAQEILKGNVHLGGEEKKVTVLFADIREFTKMTQNMVPQQVIDLLNGCMTKVSSVIDKNGGVIDKFVGDEAMALFGAPITKEDAAFKAIRSAVEIIDSLRNWNVQRRAEGMPEIDVGIGIHTGRVLAGNMGAENRLNYTVLGSNVNLASRLCNAAKRMEILVTKDTLEEPFVKDQVAYEALPPMSFRGFDKEVEIFRVIGIKNVT